MTGPDAGRNDVTDKEPEVPSNVNLATADEAPPQGSTRSLGEAALSLRGAWKLFGHVTALKDVSLEAHPGEILAIVGDNGAGKSTLVKSLAGVYRLDRGQVSVGGRVVDRADARGMRKRGLSVVFQDLALVETMDVATNMYLGQPLRRWRLLLRKSAMRAGAADTLRDLGVRLPSVRIPIGDLSGGQRQSVAIARAVLENNSIFLLDEPTAALGVRETAQVGHIISELRERGKAVIIVSHDLEFVFRYADRIQVMRLGTVQGVREVRSTTREEIVSLITGLGGGHGRSEQQ